MKEMVQDTTTTNFLVYTGRVLCPVYTKKLTPAKASGYEDSKKIIFKVWLADGGGSRGLDPRGDSY